MTKSKYVVYDETGNINITDVYDNFDDAFTAMLAKLKYTVSEYYAKGAEEYVYVKEIQEGEIA